jgi:hypothetical protein
MELSEFEAEHPAEPRYVMKNGKRVELATDVQLAQERAEKTRTPPFADPRYWAAFVVIGDCKLQATPTPPFVHITGA